MNKAKIIKNETEYQAALGRLETLMDAQPGSSEEEELDLLSLLLVNYEKEHFPIELPDPIEAIKFRMDQQGLSRKDLIPYIGSQSKVSEVLSGKRPLSLTMIRNLHEGLGIPAEVLLQAPGAKVSEKKYDSQAYPFNEMFKRDYFPSFRGTLQEAKQYAEELLTGLFSIRESAENQYIFCRNSDKTLDENALKAWQARVYTLAAEKKDLPLYTPEKLTPDVIRDIVKMSQLESGPLLAREMLEKRGIPLIILPHLNGTYLDGACFKSPEGQPIIGMTLRYDRLDNFWFTLVHELTHALLHLETDGWAFFDDTEHGERSSSDPKEIEANSLTRELLIPAALWEPIKAELLHTNQEAAVIQAAEKLGVDPAIVAGRIRWESGDYTRFSNLVRGKQIKKMFSQEQS